MLNLNKHKQTKPKPEPTLIFKNCSHLCAYHCAQLSHRTQHRTVLIIFSLILTTIITAQMISTGGDEEVHTRLHVPTAMYVVLVVVRRIIVDNKNKIFDIKSTSTDWRRYLTTTRTRRLNNVLPLHFSFWTLTADPLTLQSLSDRYLPEYW